VGAWYPQGGGSGGGSGTVTSVAAGDASVVVAGTPTVAPTIETASLAVIAGLHASAGAITASSQKITNLANGTASSDAAAFGQIPTGYAHTSSSPGSPSQTISTTPVMMGLAGTITPGASGTVRVTIDGEVESVGVTGVANMTMTMRTGTGSAPANGVAVTGTQRGNSLITSAASATSSTIPFSLTRTVTGLVVGTAVWLDIALNTNTSSDAASINSITITADEQA
jgi:hypothetical protein